MITIKNEIKKVLDLKDEYDDVLEIMIDDSIVKISSFCNLNDYSLADLKFRQAVKYCTIIDFNKRFKEGISSESTSGFSTSYQIEETYLMLINSLKKARFF